MKIGRNAPCPCGSGKKYKKCCLDKAAEPDNNRTEHPEMNIHEPSEEPPVTEPAFNIRPYALAILCEPYQPHVQQLLKEKPELTESVASRWLPSTVKQLSTPEIISRLSDIGIDFDQTLFIEKCRQNTSAWDTATDLWPEYACSSDADVSDFVCLAACVLWKRLHSDKRLQKVSYEMIDDWLDEGFSHFEVDDVKAADIWLNVWNAFKELFDVSNLSVSDIDSLFKGNHPFENWFSLFNMCLIGAALENEKYLSSGIQYLEEFIQFFSQDVEERFLSFRSDLCEFYCRSGNFVKAEEIMKNLVKQHPDKSIGYIGLEMVLDFRTLNGEKPAYAEQLEILEKAKNYPVTDGEDYDLELRILELKKKTAE